MSNRYDLLRLALLLPALTFAGAARAAGPQPQLSFGRDIQPILSRNCYACHGADSENRRADLRLDRREVAIELGVIVPGKPDESELIRRVFSNDEDERMPPVDSQRALTTEQKELLRDWIANRAEYTSHYAFTPPDKPRLPEVVNDAWCRNPIDPFILARLEQEEITPADQADRYTLIRRLSLDLIGLPPTPEQADRFAKDTDPRAYEALVDRLLASPAYGERWGRLWLDLARYADTHGYEKDRARSIWPYRDWVVNALNADMPYDRFSIEQLAGDMLADPTIEQKIATGFHRNTMLNEEGGIDPLEYRFHAIVDRVATTGTIWLGLTVGCAQCHSHKYDPITHTEYYQLMAMLNNADEPDLLVPDQEIARQRKQMKREIAELEAALVQDWSAASNGRFSRWLDESRAASAEWTVLRPTFMESNLPRLELLDDGSIFSSGDITKRDVFKLRFPLDALRGPVTSLRLEVLPDERLPAGGPGRAYYTAPKGVFFLSEFTARMDGRPVRFARATHSWAEAYGGGKTGAPLVIDGNGHSGWSTSGRPGEEHRLVLNLVAPLPPQGELEIELLFQNYYACSLGRFRVSATSKSEAVEAQLFSTEVEALLLKAPQTLTSAEQEQLRHAFLYLAPELKETRKPIEKLRSELPAYPTAMVLQERPLDNPRLTRRHHRGEFTGPREEVVPGVPAVFAALPEGAPANRLTFARWLVSERNPLMARVAANRAWQALFGAGLVATSGDYGTQSELPSHPELLDWLACEFIEQGLSLKQLHRLIVTSSAYRQSSIVRHELLARDPQNKLLARGPRYRLDAELVRDVMLLASGLLSRKMGGASVYPPQPKIVAEAAFKAPDWIPSPGEDRYRRSLYTFRKRTAPFAAYAVFDAPSGEYCVAHRNRSNTPLQALTLLNDEMFVEMACGLARNAILQTDLTTESRATLMFRRLLTRPPADFEHSAMLNLYHAQLARLQAGELDPVVITGDEHARPELAAWILVARALMNLDETITQQ